jgi:hypothetical protein
MTGFGVKYETPRAINTERLRTEEQRCDVSNSKSLPAGSRWNSV